MSPQRRLGTSTLALALALALAGCSHAVFPTSGGGSSTAPAILTLHDAPATLPPGVTLVSFEATVTGAVLQPGNVSLISSPQMVELTQLQTNSAYLSTTKVALNTYTSLMLTYANPQYTFVNDSGVPVTVGTQVCAANATCVVSNPTVDRLTATATFTSPVMIGQNSQALIEADVNLNDIIQTNFHLDFSKSAAATVTQNTSSTTPIITGVMMSGQVGTISASAKTFQFTPAFGLPLTITTGTGTLFQFARANCSANNFTCLATGQIVNVAVSILGNGTTFEATEVDFDDASGTQQVSGMIVAENATPPTSFTLVVHNTIPPVVSLPPGTVVKVNIGTSVVYVINNGSFALPTGLSFASTSDVIVGQEVQARVASGTSISNATFTTDRLALEPTQLQATATKVSPTALPPQPSYVLNPLPPLFSAAPLNAVQQIQVLTVIQGSPTLTSFQVLSPSNMNGVTNGQLVTTGGFLFNTPSAGSPTIVATVVRGQVSGT